MSLADELIRLEQMRDRGTLTADEFEKAKARALGVDAPPPITAINNFRRSVDDRWIGGVCGGLATSTGLDSWIWRLLMVLLTFAGGSGLLIYLALWIFVPQR
jgi:phage shock protein C